MLGNTFISCPLRKHTTDYSKNSVNGAPFFRRQRKDDVFFSSLQLTVLNGGKVPKAGCPVVSAKDGRVAGVGFGNWSKRAGNTAQPLDISL
jgi:hypothetical protein